MSSDSDDLAIAQAEMGFESESPPPRKRSKKSKNDDEEEWQPDESDTTPKPKKRGRKRVHSSILSEIADEKEPEDPFPPLRKRRRMTQSAKNALSESQTKARKKLLANEAKIRKLIKENGRLTWDVASKHLDLLTVVPLQYIVVGEIDEAWQSLMFLEENLPLTRELVIRMSFVKFALYSATASQMREIPSWQRTPESNTELEHLEEKRDLHLQTVWVAKPFLISALKEQKKDPIRKLYGVNVLIGQDSEYKTYDVVNEYIQMIPSAWNRLRVMFGAM